MAQDAPLLQSYPDVPVLLSPNVCGALKAQSPGPQVFPGCVCPPVQSPTYLSGESWELRVSPTLITSMPVSFSQ